MVARDSDGNFLLAAAKKIPGEWRPETAEAMAAEFGAQLAAHFHYSDVVLESDCLTLIQKMHHPEEQHDEVGVLCRSIRRLLFASGQGGWKHISREANEAAHLMAHTETRWNERVVWVDQPPVFLIDQLLQDNVTASID
ncbi:unnamed protein product [Linum tenue]|uniref:RNase H type-1 domain-containing protein n=1 Tax=Linum tenue TaxID=586396 RepID=A0AAV0N5H8_9ROSI|nr:unnamed protein product [Linum tenue]